MPVRILIVDDDAEFREELKSYLEEYDCLEAASGEEAMSILRRPHEIDLVILDVMMPGMNGTDALRVMKRLDPDLGIIILTAYSSEDVAVAALKGHADDYVQKGPHIDRVREVVRRLAEERRLPRAGAGDRDATKIERVKLFLERNCYKKTTLDDAARAVSLSPKYLSRIFAEITGTGFAAYRRSIKIIEGKRLLSSSGMNVNQIAERLGYANAESFIRAFRKSTGFTPSAFRAGAKRRSRADSAAATRGKGYAR